MGDNKKDEIKLEGQRRAIQEHIVKYKERYIDYEKDFALKTIQRAQKEIADIKRRNPNTSVSPLDTWKPLAHYDLPG